MSDNEIIKALERMTEEDPEGFSSEILDLINRQKAEIEKLTVNMNAYGLAGKRLAEEREILFRGKDFSGVINHSWCIGSLDVTEKENPIIIYSDRFGNKCKIRVNPETVGQYTGLTDKNGKKIFEGDIFRFEDDIVSVVIFDDGSFRFKSYGWCGAYTESGYDETGGGWGVIECEPIDWYYVRDLEVIGNIHDNPELLKGGADNA